MERKWKSESAAYSVNQFSSRNQSSFLKTINHDSELLNKSIEPSEFKSQEERALKNIGKVHFKKKNYCYLLFFIALSLFMVILYEEDFLGSKLRLCLEEYERLNCKENKATNECIKISKCILEDNGISIF